MAFPDAATKLPPLSRKVELPVAGFEAFEGGEPFEEEVLSDRNYYPVVLGQTVNDRYEIVSKLGWGASSTVWLARDLSEERYVALKICISNCHDVRQEIAVLERINSLKSQHSGVAHIRKLLAHFNLTHDEHVHPCLVHEPLLVDYESLDEVTLAGDMERDLHRYILKRVIEALDFLHTEAHVVHTDLRSVNVMFTTTDTSVFAEHERKQLLYPPPRKVRANGHIIYKSRPLPVRTSTVFDMLGEPILIDFGHAYIVEESTNLTSWVQPNAYRSPEVVLGLPWSYPADIWNLGAWIWHAVDGTFPFITWSKVIPEYEYDLKIHFLALVHCLGPAPADLIERSKRAETPGFFQDKGELVAALEKVKGKACGLAPFPRLNERAKKMEGKERDDFLSFIWKMLRWRPEERYTAAQLLDDEWLNGEYADSQ